jgi:Ca2+-binding RTX toxin-like protein
MLHGNALASTDDETGIVLSVEASDLQKEEGSVSPTTFSFTVSRAGDATGAVAVDWSVVGFGTSRAGADDFVGGAMPNGTVRLGAGELSGTAAFRVAGDGMVELPETFWVVLSNPTGGASLGRYAALGVIVDDDWHPDHAPIEGTARNDGLHGTAAAEILFGRDGDDRLFGKEGHDILKAGNGDDRLDGGWGADLLHGGQGADRFVYTHGEGTARRCDEILDFSRLEGDRIDLRALDADPGRQGDQALTFIGAKAFTGIGQVHYRAVDGQALVEVNLDHDGQAELTLRIDNHLDVTKADFIL